MFRIITLIVVIKILTIHMTLIFSMFYFNPENSVSNYLPLHCRKTLHVSLSSVSTPSLGRSAPLSESWEEEPFYF